MLKNLILLVVFVALVIMVNAPANAGPSCPIASISWDNSSIIAMINGGTSIPFMYPMNYKDMTVGYWLHPEDEEQLSTEVLTQPYPNGNYQWTAHLEVGPNDPDPFKTFHLSLFDNIGLSWVCMIYNCDTKHRITQELIYPDPDGIAYTSWSDWITTPTSSTGFDVLVAAWDETPSVPEPSSMLGLSGFGAMLLCRLRLRSWSRK